LKKSVLSSAVLIVAGFTFISCGGSSIRTTPTSGITTRVFASQSVFSAAAFPGVVIVDGQFDTLARAAPISAGASPGLMAVSPDRTSLLVFDSASNSVNVINTQRETSAGTISLPGPTTSMVALNTGFSYVAVPDAPFSEGSPPGAVQVINLAAMGTAATISVPNAQTVVASPDESHLLIFSGDSDVVTVMFPLLLNTGNPVTTTVTACAGCRPAYAIFSSDGGTAYILNCGAECGGTQGGAGVQPSVQTLDMSTLTLGTSVFVDGATIAYLTGSTLYVAGNSATNNSCAGQTPAVTTCGRLDIVDVGSMAVTGSAIITDGTHDRIDMSVNGQLFIGSHTCTNIGDVNNPQGEVRGCLSIFNTSNGTVVIPPDNGDVTGLQSFASRYVEYVAEGGNLRVYDTTIDSLLLTSFISTGTITIPGQIVDIKAVDFF
jgi:hypothetical protein